MNVIFASKNKNKVAELREILELLKIHNVQILSLDDVGIDVDVNENMNTLEKNALKKAKVVYELLPSEYKNLMVIAEDFGFFIKELPDVAGVLSNRWFSGSDDERNKKILELMKEKSDRKCYYKSVFAVCNGSEHETFVGCIDGNVACEIKGNNGFAYDYIFLLENGCTLAEISKDEKNKISSRRIAFEKVVEYIKKTGIKSYEKV